ncbi:MAG: hypothetical protein M3N97_05065 [Pseudomonadota bacterium]|nr:hypothetical protein [Pseudomonadota bacterium]
MGGEELGLSLEDGKEIVRELQARKVAIRVEMLEAATSTCIGLPGSSPENRTFVLLTHATESSRV